MSEIAEAIVAEVDEVDEEEIHDQRDAELVAGEDAACDALVSGENIWNFIELLPTTNTKNSRGLTLNRIVKFLQSCGGEEILPKNSQGIAAFNKYNKDQKSQLQANICGLESPRDSTSIELIKKALKNQKAASSRTNVVAAAPEGCGSVVNNRYALLSHSMVDTRLNALMVEYNTKLSAGERPQALTEGASKRKTGILERIIEMIAIIKKDISNPFLEDHPMLKDFHPELGEIKDPDMLKTMITQMRNSFDTLKTNLSKSGTNEDGTVDVQKALQFCKRGRTLNMGKICAAVNYLLLILLIVF